MFVLIDGYMETRGGGGGGGGGGGYVWAFGVSMLGGNLDNKCL